MPIHELTSAYRRGETTPTAATEAYLARIAKLDGELGAYLTVTREHALRAAADADARYRAGTPLGPLDGAPLAYKDVLCTRGVTTTCGSRMLERFVPPYDATVIARLAAAGAVMLGKGNMDEFAMGSSTEHSAFKPTRNPWDLARVPGGSSGGPAAAVAAGLAAGGLGTDTGGSIRQPPPSAASSGSSRPTGASRATGSSRSAPRSTTSARSRETSPTRRSCSGRSRARTRATRRVSPRPCPTTPRGCRRA